MRAAGMSSLSTNRRVSSETDEKNTRPSQVDVSLTSVIHREVGGARVSRDRGAGVMALASGFHGGVVPTGGRHRERCSWPGMIRGVQTRIDPLRRGTFQVSHPTLF